MNTLHSLYRLPISPWKAYSRIKVVYPLAGSSDPLELFNLQFMFKVTSTPHLRTISTPVKDRQPVKSVRVQDPRPPGDFA
jgi:hypothetical protein